MARRIKSEDELTAYMNMSRDEKELAKQKKRAARRSVMKDELELGISYRNPPEFELVRTRTVEPVVEPVVKPEMKPDMDADMKFRTVEYKKPEVDLNEQILSERMGREKKKIYMDILLDGTISFTEIFPSIYRVLSEALQAVDEDVKSKDGYSIHYGLTILHDNGTAVSLDGGYFTKDLHVLLDAIRTMDFYGGSSDGTEDISDGIRTALRVLANHTEEYASRGLIFLTDSKSHVNRANFQNLDGAKYNNLRFVVGYMYDTHYGTKFTMVDGSGNPANNDKNKVHLMEIGSLLENNGDESIQDIVASILRKVSVWSDE